METRKVESRLLRTQRLNSGFSLSAAPSPRSTRPASTGPGTGLVTFVTLHACVTPGCSPSVESDSSCPLFSYSTVKGVHLICVQFRTQAPTSLSKTTIPTGMQKVLVPRCAGIKPFHRRSIITNYASHRTLAVSHAAMYETVKTHTEGPAGIITISKPKALNALSTQAR